MDWGPLQRDENLKERGQGGTSGPLRSVRKNDRVKSRKPRAIRSAPSTVSMGMRRIGLPVGRVSDEALLAGLATGDHEITVAFVRRFQSMVYGVAVAVLGDPQLAEDVAQQTFERAWRHAQMYDSRRGSVKTWLRTISHNLAIDAVRARKPTPIAPEDLDSLLDLVTDTPERHALAEETSSRMRAAVATLPREQGRALVMAGIYGMTAQQISEVEQIPLGTAKTRIRTAMGKLRNTLGPERVDDE
jgi:RNA polymerase sigma factor (sigma-70 family)